MHKHLVQPSPLIQVFLSFCLLILCNTLPSIPNLDLSSESLDPSTTGFSFLGNAAGDRFGYSVSTAGDINGDGYPDILIGAHSKENYRGMVYVIYGGLNSSLSNFDLSQTALDPATTGFTIRGYSSGNLLGLSVNTAGDINGDKYDDIIISAYLKDNIQGEVYVIYGKETSLLTNIDLSVTPLDPISTGFTLRGFASNNFFGYSVSAAGDVNKDGYDDIIIGAFGYDNNRGAAYVIYGGPTISQINIAFSSMTLDPASTGFMVTGNAAGDRLGRSVSNAGDINNDGYDDIIIGAYQNDNNRGAVYVIYGGENSLLKNLDLSITTLNPASTGFTVFGSVANEVLGYSARTSGDINNDGYDDIIIGGIGTARVYIIYGGPTISRANIALSSTTLNPASTGFIITGNSLGDNFGVSVDTAGDVNGDGYGDVIIGASGRNSEQGIAYVFFGGKTSSRAHIDLSLTALDPETMGFSIAGDGIGDFLGYSVGTAGDINGDEYDDIIVGASKHNAGAGSAYLIYAVCIPNSDASKPCSQRQFCEGCKQGYSNSNSRCNICPTNCQKFIGTRACQVCDSGYTLTDSRCVANPDLAAKISKTILSTLIVIGSIFFPGSSAFTKARLVSKIVLNTRYIDLVVTEKLAEIYKNGETELISWDFLDVLPNKFQFKTLPKLFEQYDIEGPFVVNYWSDLMTNGIALSVFAICILLKQASSRRKSQGQWFSFILQKVFYASLNFSMAQIYGSLDDILFYVILDLRTNQFNATFSWMSFLCAVIFFGLGGLLLFLNLQVVKRYQKVKELGTKEDIEAFNQRYKSRELLYSDYQDTDSWSHSFFAVLVVRSSFSSSLYTIFYDLPIFQTGFLMIIDGTILLFLLTKKPFRTLRATVAQYFFEIMALFVHICVFIMSLRNDRSSSPDAIKRGLCTTIIYMNTAMISGGSVFMLVEIYKIAKEKITVWKEKRKGKHLAKLETSNTQNNKSEIHEINKGKRRIAIKKRMNAVPINFENSFVSEDNSREDMLHDIQIKSDFIKDENGLQIEDIVERRKIKVSFKKKN